MNKDSWGGNWTERKLDAFEKYVKAYLTIMNKNRDKFGWELIYFDAFAGSGSRESDQKIEENAFLFDITDEEKSVYRGAAERVININLRGFDYYYFIEDDEASKIKLEEKLKPVIIGKKLQVKYCIEDANDYIIKLSEKMKSNTKYRSLTMVDPFGMQVNWESLKQLKETKTDLWILIPSGVIINRLLDGNGELPHIEKLVSFFGLPEAEIKKLFYVKQESRGLFDIENDVKKLPNSIPKIVEVYIRQLKTIFEFVTSKPLVLLNSHNVPIYHFAFASSNATALKIANSIIGKELK